MKLDEGQIKKLTELCLSDLAGSLNRASSTFLSYNDGLRRIKTKQDLLRHLDNINSFLAKHFDFTHNVARKLTELEGEVKEA